MNGIVIDTNIVFSALHKSNAEREYYLFHQDLDIVSTELLWLEIERYSTRLRRYSRRASEEFESTYWRLHEKIVIVKQDAFSLASIIAAYRLCYGADLDDAPFVALALETNMPLWTGDEELRQSLQKRGFTNFFHERFS